MHNRLATITKLLAQNPQDVFLHYSLGMEYFASGQHIQAASEFDRCIELDASYLAAYVEGGKCLRAAGLLDHARAIFQRGLEVAARQGDRHAEDHIRQQIEGLGG